MPGEPASRSQKGPRRQSPQLVAGSYATDWRLAASFASRLRSAWTLRMVPTRSIDHVTWPRVSSTRPEGISVESFMAGRVTGESRRGQKRQQPPDERRVHSSFQERDFSCRFCKGAGACCE